MNKRNRSLLAPAVSVALLAALTAATPPASAASRPARTGSASPHPGTGSSKYGPAPNGHYYGSAYSGYGSTGTEAQIWTWNHWSVTPGSNFSNEAAWLWDPSLNGGNPDPDALEVGFYSGLISANLDSGPGFTNGMLPYYSTYDGVNNYVQTGAYLPSNTYVYLLAQIVGNDDFAAVGDNSTSFMDQEITNYPMYSDKANLLNQEQGEVTDSGTWMGGGSGDNMTMYWLDNNGNVKPWLYITTSANSPYWAKSNNNTDYFENGGY